MRKTAREVDSNVFNGVFTQDSTLYSRCFYFFGIFASFLVFFSFFTFFLYFLGEKTELPKDVLITNITFDSITLSWRTDKETKGLVIYTPAQTPKIFRPIALLSLPSNLRAYDKTKEPTQYHTVTITKLSPNTAYLYRISTGLRTYKIDSEGKLLPAIKTAPKFIWVTL